MKNTKIYPDVIMADYAADGEMHIFNDEYSRPHISVEPIKALYDDKRHPEYNEAIIDVLKIVGRG